MNNTANVLGSLGLVNNGNQARIQFWAPSVAHMLFRLNGNNRRPSSPRVRRAIPATPTAARW